MFLFLVVLNNKKTIFLFHNKSKFLLKKISWSRKISFYKKFGDYLVKMIFYSKTKSTKIDAKMLHTILKSNLFWKNCHFLAKKCKKSWFFGKKIDKIDFFIIIQTKNYNIQIENSKISKSKSQGNRRKEWSFLGIFVKNDGSEYMICEFSEHKNSIYPYDFAEKGIFCENTIYPYVFENNPFFSIFFKENEISYFFKIIISFGSNYKLVSRCPLELWKCVVHFWKKRWNI